MDTERFIFTQGELDDVAFQELSLNDLETVEFYVEITRNIQEIHMLFRMFVFNLECFWKEFDNLQNEKVSLKERIERLDEKHPAINALVTNVISSGKTLSTAMESYMSQNYDTDDQESKDFLKMENDTYDHSFSYRFLIRLRDFAQHGHVPVSLDLTQLDFVFDLEQILFKPHFSHNKTLEKQIEAIITEIRNTYRDTPTLALNRTIAEFSDRLLLLYLVFLKAVYTKLVTSRSSFMTLVSAYSNNIIKEMDIYKTVFLYKIENRDAHVVPLEQDISKEMKICLQEADSKYSVYHALFEDIEKHIIKIYVKENRIEVDFGERELE